MLGSSKIITHELVSNFGLDFLQALEDLQQWLDQRSQPRAILKPTRNLVSIQLRNCNYIDYTVYTIHQK